MHTMLQGTGFPPFPQRPQRCHSSGEDTKFSVMTYLVNTHTEKVQKTPKLQSGPFGLLLLLRHILLNN